MSASPLGSESWWRDVRKLGVQRDAIESILDAASPEGDRARIDPHGLYAASNTEQAVLLFALFPFVPTYATLMYVAHTWSEGGLSLHEWIAQQYATTVTYGSDTERKAALYSLWVDFFEVKTRAAFLFPRLWSLVHTDEARAALLECSGPVPWEVKRAAYLDAVASPQSLLHHGLARGLVSSIYDFYGSVEPVEALALWSRLTAMAPVDDALASAFTQGLAPTRWRLDAIITVDESDERWQRWLPKASLAKSFLVELAELSAGAAWITGSELRWGNVLVGTLAHRAFPFDRAIEHTEQRGPRPVVPEGRPILFRLDGNLEEARRALGRELTAWPAGTFVPEAEV